MAYHELKFEKWEDLKNTPTQEDQYLIDGFLWEQDHIILLAKEKVGKSILSLQMACALSCGEPFLGEYNVFCPMQVAYISTEGKKQEIIERLKSMTGINGVNVDGKNLRILSTHSWQLDSENGYEQLTELIDAQHDFKPKVIILDPLYMSMSGSLNDEESSRRMVRNMRRLSAKFDAAIVANHHQHRPKRSETGDKIDEGDDSIMGSFVWKAFPDHLLHLNRLPDNTRTISCTTQRGDKAVENMKMELVSNPLHFKILGTVDHPPYVDKVLDVILQADGICIEEIRVACGIHTATVKKALAYLQRPNVDKIKKLNPGHRPVFFVGKDFMPFKDKPHIKEALDVIHGRSPEEVESTVL